MADGEGILGSTSAALRGLGPGAILDFGHRERIRVTAVLPDELVGAAELLVSRQTGRRIGILQERYLLVQPPPGGALSTARLLEDLRPLLPTDLGVNRNVQVRAPGQTPYFRAGDAVLPPVLVKALFREFAARPGRQSGTLEVDPSWRASHLVTTRVPVLGTVTCNRGIVAQLRSAMLEVRVAGLRHTVDTFNGCFVSRFIGWNDSNMISYHSWGTRSTSTSPGTSEAGRRTRIRGWFELLSGGGSSGAGRGSFRTETTSNTAALPEGSTG